MDVRTSRFVAAQNNCTRCCVMKLYCNTSCGAATQPDHATLLPLCLVPSVPGRRSGDRHSICRLLRLDFSRGTRDCHISVFVLFRQAAPRRLECRKSQVTCDRCSVLFRKFTVACSVAAQVHVSCTVCMQQGQEADSVFVSAQAKVGLISRLSSRS